MSRRFVCGTALAALMASACASGDGNGKSDDGVTTGDPEALTAKSLPGRLEAESYRAGGEGVGYHDTTAGNSGGVLRKDGVDLEKNVDPGAGYDVGWTEAGEWLAYDVHIAKAGKYTVTFRLSAKAADPKTLHLELDGKKLAGGSVTLTGGDSWTDWKDVVTSAIDLPAGAHVLKVVFDSSKVDLDYLDVVAVGASGRTPLVVGMATNTAIPPGKEQSDPHTYRQIVDKYFVPSKMKVDRVFNPTFPTTYAKSQGRDDPANGNVSFLSVKPPNGDIQGVAAGNYKAEIQALAASIPAGSYLTMFHEPEDDMEGKEFVPMFQAFYDAAKEANPSLMIGYVAMAFHWRPGAPKTVNQDDWWPGDAHTDFLGVDIYVAAYQKTARSLDVHPYFQRWYTWAKAKGKPCILPEYGIESVVTGGFDDQTRADSIRASMDWLWTQPQIKLVLWWDGTKSLPGGRDYTLNPTTSETSDIAPLARKAWNDSVEKYGSTGTSW